MDRDGVDGSINAQKKNEASFLAILTEQAWLIKDLLYGFFWRDAAGSPERTR